MLNSSNIASNPFRSVSSVKYRPPAHGQSLGHEFLSIDIQKANGPKAFTLAAVSSFVYAIPQILRARFSARRSAASRASIPSFSFETWGSCSVKRISATKQYWCAATTPGFRQTRQCSIIGHSIPCQGRIIHNEGKIFPGFGAIENGLKLAGKPSRHLCKAAAKYVHSDIRASCRTGSVCWTKQKLMIRAKI